MRGDLTRHVTHGPITSTAIVKRDVFFEAYSSWGHGEGGGRGAIWYTVSSPGGSTRHHRKRATNKPTNDRRRTDGHTHTNKKTTKNKNTTTRQKVTVKADPSMGTRTREKRNGHHFTHTHTHTHAHTLAHESKNQDQVVRLCKYVYEPRFK